MTETPPLETTPSAAPSAVEAVTSEPTRPWRWAARAAVVLPIVVAAVRAIVTGWFPVGDNALLAVRAYDVGTQHHPLLGSWTSASLALGVSVNNPGPLYFDLVAPFMWTIGRLAAIGPATAAAVGSINVAFALGTVAVGNRLGGWRVERWMLLLVAALTWSMGSELLIDIWQPHALLLVFVCFLMLTVGVAADDLRLLPWWAGVASLILQTHVAYVYVVAALGMVVVWAVVRRVGAVASTRSASLGSTARELAGHRVTLVTVGVLAIAWLQPVIEQVFGEGEGNLQRLATNAGGGELTVGAGHAVKIVAAVTALPPWWTRFGYVDSVPSTPLTDTAAGPQLSIAGLPGAAASIVSLVILFGVLATLFALLRSPNQRVPRMALVVACVGMVVAIGGITIQTVGLTGLGNHQVRFLFALSLFVHVSIAWGVTELVRERVPAVRSLDWLVAATLAAFVLANLPLHAHALGPTADRAASATLERTFDDLTDFEPSGAVVYETDNIRVFEPYSWAVVMRLREIGVEARFEDEIEIRQYGNRRRADGTEVARVRQLERSDALLYRGEACTLSLRSGVSPAEESAVDSLVERAAADLASGSVAVDTDGLPADVTALVDAATSGDRDAAARLVMQGLVPVLVDEARLAPTPAITAAADATPAIIARVNSTLRIVVAPATVC